MTLGLFLIKVDSAGIRLESDERTGGNSGLRDASPEGLNIEEVEMKFLKNAALTAFGVGTIITGATATVAQSETMKIGMPVAQTEFMAVFDQHLKILF